MDPIRNNLKLLFISSDKFPPFRVDVSVLFGKEIVGRGHVIDWVLQSDKTCHRDYKTKWSGGRVWVGRTDNGTSRIRRLKNHLFGLLHDFKMFKIVQLNKYDFILVKDKFLSALLAILISRKFGTKFIFWLSYPFPEEYLFQVRDGTARYPLFYWTRGHSLKVLLYRLILPFSDHIFVQTEQMKRDIAKHSVSLEKMTPVPMAVQIEKIPFFGYDVGQESNGKEKILLYLGTLFKTRKIDFLIRVLEKVMRREKKVKLYLVGGVEDALDEKIIRDDVTIVKNDRLTYDGSEFRVMGIRIERVESTDIIQIIKVDKVTDTTLW